MDSDERARSSIIGVGLLVALVVVFVVGVSLGSLGLVGGFGDPENPTSYQTPTATATPHAAETTGSFTSRNDTVGAVGTRNVVKVTVPDSGSSAAGSSLSRLAIIYPSGFNASTVTASDVLVVGIDEDSDGEIDVELTSDVSDVTTSNNGTTVTLTVGGNTMLNVGETVVAEFDAIANPETSGEYNVGIELNDGEETASGTVEIS